MLCCGLLLVPVTVVATLLIAQSLPLPDPVADGRSPFCDEPDPQLRATAELIYWCATAVLTAGVASLPEFWAAVARARRCWNWKGPDAPTAPAHQVRRRKREMPPYRSQDRTPARGRVPR